MSKFLDTYLEKFEQLPPVQITRPTLEPETTAEIPFFQALDQAIVGFVRARYPGMFVPDLKEFLYEFCRAYPVRESDIKPRVEMLKTRGWRI